MKLQSLFSPISGVRRFFRGQRPPARTAQRRTVLQLETLENRLAPAVTFTVIDTFSAADPAASGGTALPASALPSGKIALGLRFEVRDYIYRLDEQDVQFRHAFDIPAGFEETINDLAFTGGFSILF